MLFKVLDSDRMKSLFDRLAREAEVIGPVQSGTDRNGKPVFSFEPVREFAELRLDYTSTHISAKRFFLPSREEVASFTIDGKDWHKSVSPGEAVPRVFFGLHACDINALNKLDKVLLEADYPMPWYAVRRKNAFIVGFGCSPQPFCFCRSMGTDTAILGFDMFLTDIGERHFVEILTNDAFNLLADIGPSDPSDEDHVRYRETVAEHSRKFTARVDTTDLTKILDMEFQSPVWKQWGDRCLACGSCAGVCPTCYCYSIEEEVDLDLRSARKTKTLHSCNLIDFAVVAGDHNFRPERHVRLKYRYYHKHRGFVEAFEEPLCVGCGRCGETCLARITVPEVISSVRGTED